MAMARWTFLSLGSIVVAGALAQLVLASCVKPPPGAGVFYDDEDSSLNPDPNGSTGASAGSGGGDDAGAGSSGSPRSGASAGSGGSSGQTSGSSTGSGDPDSGYVVRKCGAQPCDLRSNTCCLPVDGGIDASYCVGGSTTSCGSQTATYHCLGTVDCPASGNLCCGTYDLNAKTAATVCQTAACSTVQFCMTDGECQGTSCVAQSCMGVSPLHLCGLQSQAPFSCTAL